MESDLSIKKMQNIPLIQFRRMAAIINDRYAFNVVIALHLNPRPTTDAIQMALAALQARHPELRCRIEREPHHRFIFDVKAPVPVEENHVDDLSAWPRFAEQLLNTRLDAAGPLLHCRMLITESRDAAVLLFSFHHAILDGTSAEVLLGNFLQLLGGEITPPLPPVEPMPDLTDLLPETLRGLRRALAMAGFLARTMRGEMAYRLGVRRQASLPLQTDAQCRVLSLEWNENETRALIRATRRSGITLNSLVTTALAAATCRVLYPPTDRVIRMITFSNLRPYLSPPLPSETLGCGISMIQLDQKLPNGSSAWDIAPQFQENLLHTLRRGDKFFTYLMSDKVIAMVIRLNRVRLGDSAMSYSGPLQLPERAGPFELTGVHAFISNNRFGPVLAGQARLFRDRLTVDLQYLDSDMSPALAAQIGENFRSQLIQKSGE